MFRAAAHLTLLLAPVVLTITVIAAVSVQQRRRQDTDDVFQSGIELVQMAVTVVDEEGRLVGNLRREDFEVFEDGGRDFEPANPQRLAGLDASAAVRPGRDQQFSGEVAGADVLLEGSNRLAHRRLGLVQLLGGSRETAGPRDGAETSQAL